MSLLGWISRTLSSLMSSVRMMLLKLTTFLHIVFQQANGVYIWKINKEMMTLIHLGVSREIQGDGD